MFEPKVLDEFINALRDDFTTAERDARLLSFAAAREFDPDDLLTALLTDRAVPVAARHGLTVPSPDVLADRLVKWRFLDELATRVKDLDGRRSQLMADTAEALLSELALQDDVVARDSQLESFAAVHGCDPDRLLVIVLVWQIEACARLERMPVPSRDELLRISRNRRWDLLERSVRILRTAAIENGDPGTCPAVM